MEESTTVNGVLNSVTQYSYGHDLISQRRFSNGQWTTHFFGYDGHGSVRFLTDVNGSVTDTYDYDAFGILVDRTGNTPLNYMYAGEQWDADLGMYFLRARYMNQNTGRFWTQDSYEGDIHEPLTLHKYLYGYGNPANKLDPSGHGPTLTEIQTTLATALTLVSRIGLRADVYLRQTKAAINQAFRVGDKTELGRLYNSLAPDVEAFAAEVIQALPGIQTIGRAVQTVGKSSIDFAVQVANRAALIEVKYSLDLSGVGKLPRVVEQLSRGTTLLGRTTSQGTATYNHLVVWSINPATQSEIRTLYTALEQAGVNNVTVVTGIDGLAVWLTLFRTGFLVP